MSTAILGPGAVGGSLAVQLALAGERVVCVARRETVAAIARDGLTLVRDGVELRATMEATEHLEEPVDLLLVTVKAPGLADAIGRIGAEPTLVVPLLNGLEHIEKLRERFARVAVATIGHFEAYRDGLTRIVQHDSALITMAGDDVPAPLERACVRVRFGGGEADVLWEKLARQAPLAALTAATGLTVGELRADGRLRAAVDEACAVAAADGAATTFAEQWAIIESLPSGATSSTARDIAAGRPSELDAIGGAVVRAGRRLGVPTPTLEELIATCRA